MHEAVADDLLSGFADPVADMTWDEKHNVWDAAFLEDPDENAHVTLYFDVSHAATTAVVTRGQLNVVTL